MSRRVAFALTCVVVLAAPVLPAQAASGANHFVVTSQQSANQVCGSFVFQLSCSFGDGIVATRSTSTNWTLLGGFAAQERQPPPTRPWLAAVQPTYVVSGSGRQLTVWGSQMDQGAAPVLQVGSVPATIGVRRRESLLATLPNGVPPGWQPVSLTTSLGLSGVTRGVGVLPMLEVTSAIRSFEPVHYVVRGTPGDLMVFAIALGQSPIGFPLPGYGYSLQLDLATLVVMPPFTITRPDGEWHLQAPGVLFAVPIWVQCFLLSSGTSYAPGSFTNAVRLQ